MVFMEMKEQEEAIETEDERGAKSGNTAFQRAVYVSGWSQAAVRRQLLRNGFVI